MDLRQIRNFLVVAEERNFTRAAARLNISQSPLSQQIRRLEHELKVQLFERTTRAVDLTPAGQLFRERMQVMIALTDEAVDDTRKSARGESGRLIIGFSDCAAHELHPAVLRNFHEQAPDVVLDMRYEMYSAALVDGLLEGRLDIAVLRPPVNADGLTVEVLTHEPLIALVPISHPATAHAIVALSSLRDDWFISFHPMSTLYAAMLTYCQDAGFTPRIRHFISDTASLVTLVAADLGVALVPASLHRLSVDRAAYRPLVSTANQTSLVVAYRDNDVSPLVRRFVESSRAVAHASTPALRAELVDDDDGFNLTI